MNGIPIRMKAKRIHFLDSALYGRGKEGPFYFAGSYIIHYKSGELVEFKLIHNQNIRDWGIRPEDCWQAPYEPPAAVTAWRSPRFPEDIGVRVFKTTWENPHLEREVAAFDFVSANSFTLPFLIAITVDNE